MIAISLLPSILHVNILWLQYTIMCLLWILYIVRDSTLIREKFISLIIMYERMHIGSFSLRFMIGYEYVRIKSNVNLLI
jgi:hypothetical protein